MSGERILKRLPHGRESDVEVTTLEVLFNAFHALSRCRSGSTAGAVGRYPQSTIRSEDRPQALQGIYRRTYPAASSLSDVIGSCQSGGRVRELADGAMRNLSESG